MDGSHKVDLQPVIVVDDTVKPGGGIIGSQNPGVEFLSKRFELSEVARRFTEPEIQIDRADGRPL